MKRFATVGYEAATVDGFLDALRAEGVEILIDVRAAARSRRPGFAKTALAGHLEDAGIEYLHLRGLGTPAEGRAAARAGDHEGMKAIYREHLASPEAQTDLRVLLDIVDAGRGVCILCLEADPEHCHRSLLARAIAERLPVEVVHLRPERSIDPDE